MGGGFPLPRSRVEKVDSARNSKVLRELRDLMPMRARFSHDDSHRPFPPGFGIKKVVSLCLKG